LHDPVLDLLHASAGSSFQGKQSPQPQHVPTSDSSTSSITDEGVAAAAAAILQSGLAPGLDGVVADRIASLAYHLVLGFLQDQLSEWGAESQQWQQAVPLQALQLLSAVRDVEAAGQAAAEAARKVQQGPAASSADCGTYWLAGDACTSSNGSLHAAATEQSGQHTAVQLQQQLVQMLVSLVQRVHQYRDCNASLGPAAQSCEISSSSCGSYAVRLAPHKAFAASADEQRAIGAGIWHRPDDDAPASPAAPDSSSTRSHSSSSSSSTGYSALQSNTRREACEDVLRATACAQNILQQVDEHLQRVCCLPATLAKWQAHSQHAARDAAPDEAHDAEEWVRNTSERLQQVRTR
jgi:hypothetical protein